IFFYFFFLVIFFFFFFFFFQAEDGIRDFHVTGVQTCALPISSESISGIRCGVWGALLRWWWRRHDASRPAGESAEERRPELVFRSEERRVGKECRSWWWVYE